MRCSSDECIPETGCYLGHPDLSDCKNYNAPNEKAEPAAEILDTVRMPWTGRALGERDLAFIAASGTPTPISLVGPHDAGKTTLLGAMFLALFEGFKPGEDWSFAGSYSLSGWHDVTARLRLDAEGRMGFPAHTPDSEQRMPGLLHVALKNGIDKRDLLFADAPGEWFSRWARDPVADGAVGARWVIGAARRNLLIADSHAFSGEHKGKTREGFERIAGRLADAAHPHNVALVWTKSDLKVPKAMRQRIEEIFQHHFSGSPIFRTQVPLKGEEIADFDPKSLTELLRWIIAPPATKQLTMPERAHGSDPFLSIGRSA